MVYMCDCVQAYGRCGLCRVMIVCGCVGVCGMYWLSGCVGCVRFIQNMGRGVCGDILHMDIFYIPYTSSHTYTTTISGLLTNWNDGNGDQNTYIRRRTSGEIVVVVVRGALFHEVGGQLCRLGTRVAWRGQYRSRL